VTKDALRKVTWEHRMAAYKSSGQSARRWCAENGVNVTQLYYWLKKESTPAEQAWLPVEIKGPATESAMTIRVGEVTVEVKPGFDPDLLLRVVKTLGALC